MAKLLVQVCGDPTVDWLTIQGEDHYSRGESHPRLPDRPAAVARLRSRAGGSALILQFLKEMIPPELAEVEGRPAGLPDLLVIADSGLGFRSVTEGWPEVLGERRVPRPPVLRIPGVSAGFQPRRQPRADIQAGLSPDAEEAVPGPRPQAGARRARCGRKPEQIILQLARFGGDREHPLLARLHAIDLAARTTILTSIGDLRACPQRVGVSLSWERLFEAIIAAVCSPRGPFVDDQNNLLFHQVIVTVGASGAVIVGQEHDTLIFDRSGQEGDFARHLTRQAPGANTCVLGALAAAWVNWPPGVDWSRATRDGIALARLLYLDGCEVVAAGDCQRLQFPCQRLVKAYHEGTGDKRTDKIWDLGIFQDVRGLARSEGGRRPQGAPGAAPPRAGWSILEEAVKENRGRAGAQITEASVARGSRTMDAVFEYARMIVEEGPGAALPDVPVEMVGNWRSADRREIEGVRSVYNAMADYLKQQRLQTPLCVAVFGPPGAGKSFVVKEIARGLGIAENAQLTFNLSQFTSPRGTRPGLPPDQGPAPEGKDAPGLLGRVRRTLRGHPAGLAAVFSGAQAAWRVQRPWQRAPAGRRHLRLHRGDRTLLQGVLRRLRRGEGGRQKTRLHQQAAGLHRREGRERSSQHCRGPDVPHPAGVSLEPRPGDISPAHQEGRPVSGGPGGAGCLPEG